MALQDKVEKNPTPEGLKAKAQFMSEELEVLSNKLKRLKFIRETLCGAEPEKENEQLKLSSNCFNDDYANQLNTVAGISGRLSHELERLEQFLGL